MKDFVQAALFSLSKCKGREWAEMWVFYRMEFHRKHGRGLIMSTWHGLDFFSNVLFCLNGGDIEELGEPKGEYKNNFKKLIENRA
jgi:hypothetical protein